MNEIKIVSVLSIIITLGFLLVTARLEAVCAFVTANLTLLALTHFEGADEKKLAALKASQAYALDKIHKAHDELKAKVDQLVLRGR
jgi:hypothetical protein